MRIQNQGISGSTLQLQWAWWRPCWSELWDFPGTKIFRRSFRKDDGPNTPITPPLKFKKPLWEMRWWWRSRFGWSQFCKESFMGIPKPSIFPQKRREFVCEKNWEIPIQNQMLSQIARWATRVETRFPSGYQDVQSFENVAATSTVRSHQIRQITLDLSAEVGFCDIFRPILYCESVLLRRGF